jgi:hypothetical protein
MTRTEFQELAEVRLKEAETLLAAGLWDGAYYLAGYAVECAVKACIAKGIGAEVFPDKEFANKCFTHVSHDCLSWPECPSRSNRNEMRIANSTPHGAS